MNIYQAAANKGMKQNKGGEERDVSIVCYVGRQNSQCKESKQIKEQ